MTPAVYRETLLKIGSGDLSRGDARLREAADAARRQALWFLSNRIPEGVRVDREAYFGEALAAVWLAALRYAPERAGAWAFKTYAFRSVSDALKEERRRQDHLTQYHRNQLRELEEREGAGAALSPAEREILTDPRNQPHISLQTDIEGRRGEATTRPYDLDLEDVAEAAAVGSFEGETLERLVAGERALRVREAVASLPERERRVVELRFLEELAWEEVADSLRLCKSTVQGIGKRALTRLREILEGEGEL